MLKSVHPTIKIILLLLFGVLCIIFPFYILNHELMRDTIEMTERRGSEGDLGMIIFYGILWYVPLIIGICILTFVPLGLMIVYFKNKKKDREKENEFYTGH